jgi:hypothetical protein
MTEPTTPFQDDDASAGVPNPDTGVGIGATEPNSFEPEEAEPDEAPNAEDAASHG